MKLDSVNKTPVEVSGVLDSLEVALYVILKKLIRQLPCPNLPSLGIRSISSWQAIFREAIFLRHH